MSPGKSALIAFKAIGENGKGTDISGVIVNSAQKEEVVFRSRHNGMGSFRLAIEAGENYTAKVNLAGGLVKEYSLPPVKNSGTILRVTNTMDSDSLTLIAGATADITASAQNFFLVAKARGIVCYAGIVNFSKGDVVRKISKSLFPTGVTRFTLMTAAYRPLNERLVYTDQHDELKIQLITGRQSNRLRDSIELQLNITDREGNPVKGNFSLAVTEDAQVKNDTCRENILTRMLLKSELRGYVDGPGYYFSKAADAWQALDNLLLTQGWTGYSWDTVLNPPSLAYKPGQDLEVNGHVFNVFNKPIKGSHVLLFSKSPVILMDTLTDNLGVFTFNRFPRIDTPVFILKAVNKNGNSFNVGISVDEARRPDFIKPPAPLIMPWYVNSDTTFLRYNKTNELKVQEGGIPIRGMLLKEVKIRAKKIIRGSQNLNGPGNADIVLDEADLQKSGKKNLLELLQGKIKGFTSKSFTDTGSWSFIQNIQQPILLDPNVTGSPSRLWYFVNNRPIKFIVDGIAVADIYPTSSHDLFSYQGCFNTMNNFLLNVNAEDIKGVEVDFSGKYTSLYIPITHYDVQPTDVSIIEITTRAGHGPGINNTPGIYLYKPLPLSWPKQFYKPKYNLKNLEDNAPDLRSTIDWEPNVVTDKNGKALVWFYAGNTPSAYTVIIEGTDRNGNIGYSYSKISITK